MLLLLFLSAALQALSSEWACVLVFYESKSLFSRRWCRVCIGSLITKVALSESISFCLQSEPARHSILHKPCSLTESTYISKIISFTSCLWQNPLIQVKLLVLTDVRLFSDLLNQLSLIKTFFLSYLILNPNWKKNLIERFKVDSFY